MLADGVRLEGDVAVGEGALLSRGVTVGPPQHLSHLDAPHSTRIGARAILREFVTVHGSTEERPTTIGEGAFLMALCHVGHDCRVGRNAVLTNLVQLAGHVTVGEGAVVGGGTMVHQFLEIGAWAMVAGMTPVRASIPPYALVADSGEGAEILGVNRRGLPDAGARAAAVEAMKAWKGAEAPEAAVEALGGLGTPQALLLLAFLEKWKKRCRWHR